MVLLRVWESHEQACDCGVGLMLSSTSIDYWLGRTRAVYADLYRREGEASKAKGKPEQSYRNHQGMRCRWLGGEI